MITDPNNPGFVAATTVATLFGGSIAPTISTDLTAHAWVADATGLFHTATDLKAEWIDLHTRLLNGDTTLTAVQHAEANAQTVFENTKLNDLSASMQVRDREDVQREFDAVGAAITLLGYSQTAPLTTQQYLAVERALQSHATLQELAVQGHGLNTPPQTKYYGYTQDFQNNVDTQTLFIGQGLDSNQNALTSFFDDVIITHFSYAVVTQDGHLEQLNQNANAEQILAQAAGAANDTFFLRTFRADEFSQNPGDADPTPNEAITEGGTGAPGTMVTLFGDTISTTITVAGRHAWTADENGLFTTTTDLAQEWADAYVALQDGSADLTFTQRQEANAEAVFVNTGLSKQSAADQAMYRQDSQRVFDAIAGGMQALGLDGTTKLTATQYIQLEHAINNDPRLLELYLQGYGINNPSSARYNGYRNDFANIDTNTLYIGGGALDNGERAVSEYFGDAILSRVGFDIVWRNSQRQQVDENGEAAFTVETAVEAFNATMLTKILTATDFNIPGSTPPGSTANQEGTITTLFGFTVADHLSANGHEWKVDPETGKFVTTTDLQAEWMGYYQQMLEGYGAELTPFQRWEGNAEAVFEFTALAQQSAEDQARDRMDTQREIDAIAAEITNLGIDFSLTGGVLSAADYLRIARGIQADPLLQELGIQGHGLVRPPLAKYNGYTNDFQNNVDGATFYVGGGLNNGENALTDFFDDSIITHLVYQTVAQNGQLIQLNQNGNAEQELAFAVRALNDTWFRRVFVASDFSIDPGAAGEVIFVSDASAYLEETAAPVASAGEVVSLFGSVISGSITTAVDGTAHDWTVDAKGLFHTTTDLALEWYNLYQSALENNGEGLNAIQRLEANAEAVFLNTGLGKVSEASQAVYREDAQREFDAIGAAMTKAGLDLFTPLTQLSYLRIGETLQNTPNLLELALQGHGLNNPPAARYRGYTKDFQNNVGTQTLYIGGGYGTGERAIADFFDDSILTHLLFPVIAINGELIQLNQNGATETTLRQSLDAANASMFERIYTSADFIKPAAQPIAAPVPGAPTITTTDGTVILGRIGTDLTTHEWVADANGLFHTTSNLEIEWRGYYQRMLAGDTTLTGIQRLEGNAEAVFENTGLYKKTADVIIRAREDAQREFDAIAAAERLSGIDPMKALTRTNYLAIDRKIQSDSTLYELALQGHGLNNAPLVRYKGATGDFQLYVDDTTKFIGGGLNNNQRALASFFQDNIISNAMFSVVFQNGQLKQLNQEGVAKSTLDAGVMALNDSMFNRIYTKADFSQITNGANNGYVSKGQAAYDAALRVSVPSDRVQTLFGDLITSTITINTGFVPQHVWKADSTGLFRTTTDLGKEWRGYQQIVLNGGAASLNAIQLMEANAEVVFESTKIADLEKSNPKLVQKYREDAQRCFDAMAAAMKIDSESLGLSGQSMTKDAMVKLERTIWGSAGLEELFMQGRGVSAPPSAKYNGFEVDFKFADRTTNYVGEGWYNGRSALGSFFSDVILGYAGFGTVWNQGQLVQLDQNGNVVEGVGAAAGNLNQATLKVLKKSDFQR